MEDIDKWLAENVMGWEYYKCITQQMNCRRTNDNGKLEVMAVGYSPTTNLTQALEALGKYNEAVKYDENKILYFETVGTGWNISSNTTELTNGVLEDASLEICKMIKNRSKDE